MPNDFNTQWKKRAAALHHSHCPLGAERRRQMILLAQNSVSSSSTQLTPSRARLHRGKVITLSLSAAACVAAVMMVTGTPPFYSGPQNINYNGQTVRFICNNNCDAEYVIGSFNDYLSQL